MLTRFVIWWKMNYAKGQCNYLSSQMRSIRRNGRSCGPFISHAYLYSFNTSYARSWRDLAIWKRLVRRLTCRLAALAGLLFLCGCAGYQYQPTQERTRYNVYEREWRYAGQNERPRYNIYSKRWEFSQ